MQYKIQNLLKTYNIRPSKRLGQNFLIDENVLRKIIEAGELKPDDIVLEIGPGLGILTVELAQRVKRVIAIEKDKKLCEALARVLNVQNVKNVEIINQDILKTESIFYHDRDKILTNYKLVANLPYYISSPVIRKFLEAEHKPKLMVLMLQKEVAQRICTKPPHMNLLAVAVQFYAHPKIISYVSKNSFWPRPRVDSAIIKIVPNKKSEDYSLRRPSAAERAWWSPSATERGEDERAPTLAGRTCLRANNLSRFFALVKTGFSSKRKMLKNNLKIDESVLKKIGLNPKIRAENLTIDDWIKLYENL